MGGGWGGGKEIQYQKLLWGELGRGKGEGDQRKLEGGGGSDNKQKLRGGVGKD